MKKISKFILALAIPLGIGSLSALFTKNAAEFYQLIEKPSFAPSGEIFPIMWTILYLLMGVSSLIISNYDDNQKAFTLYGISLFFNFFWSIIFFKFCYFVLAFVWLLLLIYFVIRTIMEYTKLNKTAAFLQIPYVLWLIFASILNASIIFLN